MSLKKYAIAVDSDGCVFDNMTIKHEHCFYPALINVLELVDQETYRELWRKINLSYPLRGTNRFLGFYLFLKEIRDTYKVDLSLFTTWIESTEKLGYDSLSEFVSESRGTVVEKFVLKKALAWSEQVDKLVKGLDTQGLIFNKASEAIDIFSLEADIYVVSSANKATVIREWQHVGLANKVTQFYTQEDGSKASCLKEIEGKGYDKNHILFIGDADLDFMAARNNNLLFFRINYQEEEASWSKLINHVYEDFKNQTYIYDVEYLLDDSLEKALKQLSCNQSIYRDQFQHVAVDGLYPKEENKLWTMSFYPGMMYLASFYTNNPTYIKERRSYLDSFKKRCEKGHMNTHDIGFLYELTAYYDYIATGSLESKNLMIEAADKLMLRYHETGGYIQAWHDIKDEGEVVIIIDTMLNLPFLFLVSEITGDSKYATAAKNHADFAAKTLVRDDFSTFHTYIIDAKTGKPLYGKTHQGHQDQSTWARGQSWCMYGYTRAYLFSEKKEYLEIAVKAAEIFRQNTPRNDSVYWDFDFDDERPDIRDTSASAIAACAYFALAKIDALTEEVRMLYYSEGLRILKILAGRYFNHDCIPGAGLIKEGMYHRNNGARTYTSWGDYYYFKSLMMWKDWDDEALSTIF